MSPETDVSSVIWGFIEWTLIIAFIVYWLRHRKVVSRNGASPSTGTGPRWEQDKPLPECFDEMEDDL